MADLIPKHSFFTVEFFPRHMCAPGRSFLLKLAIFLTRSSILHQLHSLTWSTNSVSKLGVWKTVCHCFVSECQSGYWRILSNAPWALKMHVHHNGRKQFQSFPSLEAWLLVCFLWLSHSSEIAPLQVHISLHSSLLALSSSHLFLSFSSIFIRSAIIAAISAAVPVVFFFVLYTLPGLVADCIHHRSFYEEPPLSPKCEGLASNTTGWFLYW